MDAKSIAATAANSGYLTGADEIEVDSKYKKYKFNKKIYQNRVYNGYEKEDKKVELKYGPNIKDWPEMITMPDHLLLEVAAAIYDEVTTTDELIPSGDTSSYRSNPLKLAEFALSRKDPKYVERAKEIQKIEKSRTTGKNQDKVENIFEKILKRKGKDLIENTSIGTVIYANKPGDGSAREQAASVQKVLGGWGNIAKEYATKRYRSNCINWGLIPFETEEDLELKIGDWIFLEDIHKNLKDGKETFTAKIIRGEEVEEITLTLPDITKDEREILLEGSLINYYKSHK
jgi:aconitate hydratase